MRRKCIPEWFAAKTEAESSTDQQSQNYCVPAFQLLQPIGFGLRDNAGCRVLDFVTMPAAGIRLGFCGIVVRVFEYQERPWQYPRDGQKELPQRDSVLPPIEAHTLCIAFDCVFCNWISCLLRPVYRLGLGASQIWEDAEE